MLHYIRLIYPVVYKVGGQRSALLMVNPLILDKPVIKKPTSCLLCS